jgi:ABC-type uncharacterized transport system involved in gliding motility auxiliary subunit
MSNDNNFHEDDFNDSWIEMIALKIGVDNILDFMERIKPESDDIQRVAEIEMSLISLKQMKGYFKRKADEIDSIIENHPAYWNSVQVKDTEEYPHRHSTADWKPDLDLVTNISDMVHGKDNIIPFRSRDKNN